MKLDRMRGGRLLIAAAAAVIVVMLIGRLVASVYVDVLWFRSVGYTDVFWKRAVWEWGVRGLGVLIVSLVIYVNLRVVARTLGGIRIKRRLGDLEISEQLPKSYIAGAAIGTSAIMGLWFGASIPRSIGLQTLFALDAPTWGVTDPILGKDLIFYALTLPVLQAGVTFAMVLAFLAFSLSSAGYAATGALRWGGNQLRVEEEPRRHLSILISAFFALLAVSFYLGRFSLLLDGTSSVGSSADGIFGFTDATARLPAHRILAVLAAFTAGGALWSGLKGRALPLATTFGALLLGGIGVGQIYPAFVQRFQVEPNELDRETPFIEHAIRFTHLGYGLDRLDRRTFDYEEAGARDWAQAADQFSGLPVWSQDALQTTYEQIEARRSYYDFGRVTIDRYDTPAGRIPVAISVREVNPAGIEDPNWQNLHLRRQYVAGMGAVASAAAAKTPEGRPPMFLFDVPPTFDESGAAPAELELERPEVFIGSGNPSGLQPYAILTPSEYLDSLGGPGRPGVDFPAGIQLSSLLRKVALAWRFRDLNLLFASEVSAESHLVFERQVINRVRKISGALVRFPAAPYPVISEGRIVWILEGFTGTRFFPLSVREPVRGSGQVRYIRNSLKITVDAFTGDVRLYVADEEDPLVAAYRRGLPSLFRPMEEMPEDLRQHIRYSKEYLDIQARVLNEYHQETAPVFHAQQDRWAGAEEFEKGTSEVRYQPEYGLFRLPGEDDASFVLSTVFVPAGRQNLTALLVARSDPDRYGELILYEMEEGVQIRGPRQVEALVEQDPEISQQFSLWRTGGSQVWTGHLHLIPVGGTLMYMEAVFLAAEEDAIPELRRFVVSDGTRVAMRDRLHDAIAELAMLSPDELGLPGTEPTPTVDLSTQDRSGWPAEALSLLDEAERRLRAGDYQGFGEALDELRSLLQGVSGGTNRGPPVP